MQWLFVFLGGGFGSMLRYLFSIKFASNEFPYATLLSNCCSSLILGALAVVLVGSEKQQLYLLVAVGFCGGFSTFSTFSNETAELLVNGKVWIALSNILLNVLLAIACIGVGYWVANKIS